MQIALCQQVKPVSNIQRIVLANIDRY